MGSRVQLANYFGIAQVPSRIHSRVMRNRGSPAAFNRKRILRLFILSICLSLSSRGLAQNVQHLSVTVPGGMPGTPLITGINVGTNSVTVTWDGPSGYYQLFENLSLTNQNWKPV